MLRSLKTFVVNLTAFAVLQLGIGIKSTVKTCLYIFVITLAA